MRSTTLFGIYAVVLLGLLCGVAGLALYSLEKSRWWDARTQLAQESYGLHLKLEANLYRLFKQHSDALLIGDRDAGAAESELPARIAQNIADIRNVIAREIEMVGEEEIEELGLLDEMARDIRSVSAALSTMSEAGEPIETHAQVERLAALLDNDIDNELDRKIQIALEEELEEVEEVKAESAAFRAQNEQLVYALLAAALLTSLIGVMSFNRQIRQPILRLKKSVEDLRNAQYSEPVDLGGSLEFRDLSGVLNLMSKGLAEREVSREEQRRMLEATVKARTSELQKLIRRLEKGEENRKRLMADISHELRTPLAIILGEADVTLRSVRDISDDVSDALARIRDSAKHTNQIVDDMLTVARFEAGQLRLDRKETDLRKVIADAVAMFPGPVDVDAPGSQVFASIDEVRMRQSVLSLLQNARRYGGPHIMATLEVDDKAMRIAIEDDGPGLSDAEKSQAFDRFFRGSNTSGQGVEGSGLGLPVVKSIVVAHGGTVDLQDYEGGGLRVVISLPKERRIKVVPSSAMRKSA